MFFRAVTQAVLIFGSETWVLLAAMERAVEGTHTRFLGKTTGKWAWRKTYGTRVTPNTEVFQEAAGNQ